MDIQVLLLAGKSCNLFCEDREIAFTEVLYKSKNQFVDADHEVFLIIRYFSIRNDREWCISSYWKLKILTSAMFKVAR